MMVAGALVLGVTQLGWSQPPTERPGHENAPAQDSDQEDNESAELGVIVAASPGAGVFVSGAIWGGPADQAGIRTGDYILSVDGQPVSSPEELRDVLQRKKPGSEARVAVWRQGKESTKELVLARAAESPMDRKAWLGVVLEDNDGAGVRISRVYPGSPAARSGLRRDDVVVAIAGQEVKSVGQMIEQIQELKPDTHVELVVRRNAEERKLTATLGAVRTAPGGWLREAFRPPLDGFEWYWPPHVPGLVMPQDERPRHEERIEALQREVERLRDELQKLRKSETDQPPANPDGSASDMHPQTAAGAYSQYYQWYGPYYTYPHSDRSVYRYRVPAYRPVPSARYHYYYHSGRPYYFQGPYVYGPGFGVPVGPYWIEYWY
jgi:hypothetical protein